MSVVQPVSLAAKSYHGAYLMCLAALCLIMAADHDILGCSSFLVEKDSVFIAGRNLDSEKFTPGVVVVNNRGIHKESRSWSELAYGQEVPNPHLAWVSRYGSITLNTFCRDYIDGGMNEAGLFIQEMSLVENKFPEDASKPCFFMMLWMQYILDNFSSVEQVIQNVSEVVIDGWNWHFFVADAAGNAAAIEFITGKPILTYGEAMPVKVLCNDPYAAELERLQNYEGFGGDRPVLLVGDPRSRDPEEPVADERFVNAATLINMRAESTLPPLDYGMKILEEMSWEGTQWSYVCDLTNQTIRFRTKDSQQIKELRFTDFNFDANTSTKMLDVHANGDIGPSSFSDYSLELNRASLWQKISGWESVFTSNGATLEEALDRIASYAETVTFIADGVH